MKKTKKGFTIVELVIVIAVIAILSAVLIPTFSSLVKKANRSADIQACRQMNTYLAVNEITEGKTILDVYDALEEGGMSAKNYKPLSSNTFFFWDKTLNRVLYTNEEYTVTFPEEYKNATKANGWYSLSGEIKKEEVEINDGAATVTKAEQLFYLVEKTELTSLTIDSDIDLMGAQIAFKKLKTLNGNNHIISGINDLEAASTHETSTGGSQEYCSGLIPQVDLANHGVNGQISITNLTIKNSVFGALTTGSVGVLIGGVEQNANATITISNVNIEDTVVNGRQKTGSLIGFFRGGTVTITNTKVKNVEINLAEAEGGKIIGATQNSCTINITDLDVNESNYSSFENVKVNLKPIKEKWSIIDVNVDKEVSFTGLNVLLKAGYKLVEAIDDYFEPEGKYRIYSQDAFLSAHYSTCSSLTIVINGTEYKPFSSNGTGTATYQEGIIIKGSCIPVTKLSN